MIQHPVTAFELVHTLGRVTASLPSQVATLQGMATTTSGHWAIIRYLWAFQSPGVSGGPLTLDRITDYVRYHQRTQLSEQLGIASAMFLIEQQLVIGGGDAPHVADVDVAFQDPRWAPLLRRVSRRNRPDYLVAFGDPALPSTTIGVVECKGTSGGRAQMLRQLARGVTQCQALVPRGRPGRHFIVATTFRSRRVRAHGIEIVPRPVHGSPTLGSTEDPTDLEPATPHPPEGPGGTESSDEERQGALVEIDEEFVTSRVELADAARLLTFAGAFEDAAMRITGERGRLSTVADREVRTYGQERYRGVTVAVRAPVGAFEIFCGVASDLLEAEAVGAREQARDARTRLSERARSNVFGRQTWFPEPSRDEGHAVASPDGCVTEISWIRSD